MATRSGVFLLASLGALSLGAGRVTRAAAPELVEMEVLGVIPLESESASLLILRQKGARVVLPIFVGRSEGMAIEQRLKQAPAHRRSAPDLLAKAIDALGGKVSRVAIEGAQAAVFSARVTLQQGDRQVELEARASDSVALAIASSAPIFATRTLMAEAGLSEEDLARAHAGSAGKPDQGTEGESPRSTPVQSF